MRRILDQHLPLKTVKLFVSTVFIDDNIRALMKTRDHWLKLARQTNDPTAWPGLAIRILSGKKSKSYGLLKGISSKNVYHRIQMTLMRCGSK